MFECSILIIQRIKLHQKVYNYLSTIKYTSLNEKLNNIYNKSFIEYNQMNNKNYLKGLYYKN